MRVSRAGSRMSSAVQRAPGDEADDQDAGLGVDDLRRDAGGEGGFRGGVLVEAQDLVDGNVVADADDVAGAGVLDDEVHVGDAAGEPHRRHLALPQRQARGAQGGVLLPRPRLVRHSPPLAARSVYLCPGHI